jgi:hypothetical protein
MVEALGDGVDPVAGECRPWAPLSPGELPGAPAWRPAAELGPLPGIPTSSPGLAAKRGSVPETDGWRGPILSVTNDIRMKTMAVDTSKISGGRSSIGWLRKAVAPFRDVVRSQSEPIAAIMPSAGSCGPWPIRPLLRTLMRAACRSAGVSPGLR